MKHLLILTLFVLPVLAGATVDGDKKLYKNVWTSIDRDDEMNHPIFYPFERWDENGMNYIFTDSEAMQNSIDTYFNLYPRYLYRIIFYHFVKGQLEIYFPYNPNDITMKDEGFCSYSASPKALGFNGHETFLTHTEYQEQIKDAGLLGYYDENPYPVAIVDEYGHDSLDYSGNVVYYPPEFFWYMGQQIKSFTLKEKIEVNQDGKELNRTIDAIAPVVYVLKNGEIIGTKEAFWVKYKDLKPIISIYYVLLPNEQKKRIISIADFFDQRKFKGEIIREDDKLNSDQ